MTPCNVTSVYTLGLNVGLVGPTPRQLNRTLLCEQYKNGDGLENRKPSNVLLCVAGVCSERGPREKTSLDKSLGD